MPTGYTAAVANGEIATLRDFAMLCARGMGALVTMRDEPIDAPIPEKLEPNFAYYGPELEKAKALLAELPTLTDEECERRARAEYDEAIAWRTEATERRRLQRQRYEVLLREVENWDCGAEGLKPFMLSQLRESIQFDCGGSDYMEGAPKAPLSGPAWRAKTQADTTSKIERFSKEVAKEQERTDARNAWLDALRASLATYDSPDDSAPKP